MASTMTIDLVRMQAADLVSSIDEEWRALRTRNEVLSSRNVRLANETAQQRDTWTALLDWVELERGDHQEGTPAALALDRMLERMRRLQADDVGRETCNGEG